MNQTPTSLQLAFILMILLTPFQVKCFDSGLAAFKLEINAERVEHNISFRAILAGEQLIFKSKAPNSKLVFNHETIDFNGFKLEWKSPELPGHYTTTIINDTNKIIINVFIMTPKSEVINGKLGDFSIGTYPKPLKGLAAYEAPRGFIQVTKELAETQISPHFKLGQFVSKQSGNYPKYIVLRPKLLEKLELLLEKVNSQGISTESFVIMSGYRTPFYNKAIGNVPNSRHVYGGAADIFIDANPVNNYMDDLNNDGQINIQDSKYLYNIADEFVKVSGRKHLTGGVGLYKNTSAHGPFVHIDVRGSKARW
jgi:hypothetical protein